MGRFFTFMSITLLSVASAVAQQEEFKFEVTTTVANPTFAIPLSGGDGGKAYNWTINWGDGTPSQNASGTGSNAGISHTYTTAKTYQITITPAGSNDRWFAAFGFYGNANGANVQTNKNLVTNVISPITPLMTRTQAEITANTTNPPSYEWSRTFVGCTNLTMGPAFTFSDAWNSITTVGDYFAYGMFSSCSGLAFTMNDVFNLPQNITTVGAYFASYMFSSCSGSAFKMGDVFNLPQNITKVRESFAYQMFTNCSGSAFKMNDVFNLPQNITTVGNSFASYMFDRCSGAAFKMNDIFNLPQNITTTDDYLASGMFNGCSGVAFTMNDVFNLPQNIINGYRLAPNMFKDCSGATFKINNVFKFPRLTQTEINFEDAFANVFNNLGTATIQSRTAVSIINGNPTPGYNRQTFTNSGCFVDRAYIPVNWGGGGLSKTFTVTYNYNDATGGDTEPSKTVTYNSAYGTLPTPTKQYTITYNYNGSAQTNSNDTYNPAFGWYLEATFDNEVTSTTIVTTFSDHTIYAEWTGALTLPTPNANTGYTFAGWYEESACVNFVGNAGDSYTPTANATLFAKWIKKDYTITASSGSNGNISPSGTITVGHGKNSPTFYFEADAGYVINKVLIDDVEDATAKANGSYIFTNVTQDHQIYVSFTPKTGISTITNDELQMTVFPNPTTGKLKIENGELKIENVEIFDVYGRKIEGVKERRSEGVKEIVLDISRFSAGIYFVKITTEAGEVIKKVVKQ